MRTTHTLTESWKKRGNKTSAGNKKSHLPSRGVRCDKGGRVRAQAPGNDRNSQTEIWREKSKKGDRKED